MSNRYLFRFRALLCALLFGLTAWPMDAAATEKSFYQGPTAVAASADGKSLFVANTDAGRVAVIDVGSGHPVRTIDMPAQPSGLVLSPDGATLYVTCGGQPGTVQIIDAGSGEIRSAVKVGHTPTGPAVSPDGKQLYVCNRFNNDVSVIDLAAGQQVTRVRVSREPIAAAVTPDGGTIFVANHLPADPSNAETVSAVVTAIDRRTHQTTGIRLPNGSSGVRGLCISPDGKHVYITHILARFHLSTTQVERGWINTNALSIIDAAAKTLLGTVLLDDVDRGAANPWGVATTADGRLICVSHAGTAEVSIIDAAALMAKLAARSADAAASREYDGRSALPRPIGVSEDLTFMSDLRRRVALRGVGPRGLTIVGQRAFVCEYFTDTLGVVMLPGSGATSQPESERFRSGAGPRQIALGPTPVLTTQRRGEMLFNDADLCLQKWQSCASCHPDARADGLNWDLMNDGLGNPKNTRNMLLAHQTPPAMAMGVRPTAEEAVRAGLRHIQFTERPEADAAAIDAYLKALEPVPSPYNTAENREAARRGEQLFFDPKIGCGACHPVPQYTDQKPYDVGSRGTFDRSGSFDTPALIECWRTAPYLHDGRYSTLEALLKEGRHGETHGAVGDLTPQQIEDLVAFMLSL